MPGEFTYWEPAEGRSSRRRRRRSPADIPPSANRRSVSSGNGRAQRLAVPPHVHRAGQSLDQVQRGVPLIGRRRSRAACTPTAAARRGRRARCPATPRSWNVWSWNVPANSPSPRLHPLASLWPGRWEQSSPMRRCIRSRGDRPGRRAGDPRPPADAEGARLPPLEGRDGVRRPPPDPVGHADPPGRGDQGVLHRRPRQGEPVPDQGPGGLRRGPRRGHPVLAGEVRRAVHRQRRLHPAAAGALGPGGPGAGVPDGLDHRLRPRADAPAAPRERARWPRSPR